MTKTTEDKLQKIELETVKAVTELKADVKNLTEIIRELRTTIQEMANNYVTNEKHTEDIAELRKDIVIVQRSGNVKAILVGVLTAVITALLTMEIAKIIK